MPNDNIYMHAYAVHKSHSRLHQLYFIFDELRNWCLQLIVKCFVKKKNLSKSFRIISYFVIVLGSVLFVRFCHIYYLLLSVI